MTEVLIATAFLCLGLGIGWLGTVVVFARDKNLVRIPEDCLIIKREVFDKLREIADVKSKNHRLKFDSRGLVNGVRQDDDDE